MKKKIFIFIITYRAQFRVIKVFKKIPFKYLKKFTYTILISDDLSDDNTKDYILKIRNKFKNVVINFNKKNIGYGAHIKKCLRVAIKGKYDYAIMIHGDNQYDPKYIKDLLQNSINNKNIMAVVGSRMTNIQSAVKGKMPIYKLIGNVFLTKFFNLFMRTKFTDAHSGLWLYNLRAFKYFDLSSITDSFNFDNQVRLSMVSKKMKIIEIPIKTFYGTENSYFHINYCFKFIIEVLFFFCKRIKLI